MCVITHLNRSGICSLLRQLQKRMRSNMGPAYDRVIFYPRLPDSDSFMAFISVADVLLHPFPFDGSKTAADGLAMGIPVVTWPAVSGDVYCRVGGWPAVSAVVDCRVYQESLVFHDQRVEKRTIEPVIKMVKGNLRP